jgi:hypothetical protein
VAVSTVLLFSAGLPLLGWAAASSAQLPRWAGVCLGMSGPLIGILGLAVGELQTVGSLLPLVSGIALARRLSGGTTALETKGGGPAGSAA